MIIDDLQKKIRKGNKKKQQNKRGGKLYKYMEDKGVKSLRPSTCKVVYSFLSHPTNGSNYTNARTI